MTQSSAPWQAFCRPLAATSLAAVALTLSLPAAPSEAQCTGSNCPASFSIEERLIQKAPTHFKLQARISQAKLPVGDAEFAVIKVNLRSGETKRCDETFSNVKVQDSVLNLEIGRGMKCVMDGRVQPFGDVVAASSDVAFEVCIGGDQNCLKPISLASVPYAVKSSYANQAQVASRANAAVQCNYAHRITADRDLFVTQKLGDGYYDFHTPTSLDGLGLNPTSNAGGFIQWTPVNAANNALHLCGRDGDKLRKLAQLMFHADKTEIRGDAIVHGVTWTRGGIRAGDVQESSSDMLVVQGTSSLRGDTTITGALSAGSSTVSDLVSTGDASIGGGITVSGHADSNTAHANKFFAGTAPTNMSLLSDALTVNGTSAFTGQSVFRGGTTHHEGDVVFNGAVYFNGRVDMPNSASAQSDVVAKSLNVGRFPQPVNGNCELGQLQGDKCVWNWQSPPSTFASPVEMNGDRPSFIARDLMVGGTVRTKGGMLSEGNIVGQEGRFSFVSTTGSVSATGAISATGEGKFGSVSTTGNLTATGEGKFGSVSSNGAVTATGEGRFGSVSTSGTVTATGQGKFGSVSAGSVTTENLTVKGLVDLGLESVRCEGNRNTQNGGFRCECRAGMKVIAGGVDCSTTLFHLYASRPSDDGNAWEGACWSGNTNYGSTEQYRANFLWAICARLGGGAANGGKAKTSIMPEPVAESWNGMSQVLNPSSSVLNGNAKGIQ